MRRMTRESDDDEKFEEVEPAARCAGEGSPDCHRAARAARGSAHARTGDRLGTRRVVVAHAIRQLRADTGAHGEGEGALFEQRLGAGRILLAAGGTLFTNRALGNDDNARLFAQHCQRQHGARRRGVVRRSAPGSLGELRPGAFLSRSAPVQDDFHRARVVAAVGTRRNPTACTGESPGTIPPKPSWCGAPAVSSRAPWRHGTRPCGCSIIFSAVWRGRRAAHGLRHPDASRQ